MSYGKYIGTLTMFCGLNLAQVGESQEIRVTWIKTVGAGVRTWEGVMGAEAYDSVTEDC